MAGKKIIIIDDDEELLEEMKDILTDSSYEVHTYAEVGDSLNAIRCNHADLIILDVKLNNTNGITVAAQLKYYPETRNTPIIIISGYYKEDDLQRMKRNSGITDYLVKPVDPQELIHMVNHVTANGHGQPG